MGRLRRVGHNFVGYAASGFTSGVSAGGVGGAIGGYMQTGTLGGTLYGAGLGMLEGGIFLYVAPKVAAGTSRFVRGFGEGFSASIRARGAANSLEAAAGAGMEAVAKGIRQGVESVVAQANVPIRRTGPVGVDPRHHNVNVLVRDAKGNVIRHSRIVSGTMTSAEQKLNGTGPIIDKPGGNWGQAVNSE